MPARALLVLLVILNLGVATWWALRPPPPAPAPWAPREGVPLLELAGEPRADGSPPALPPAGGTGPSSAAAGAPVEAGDASDATGVPTGDDNDATRCLRFGPFADAAAVASARAALQPFGVRRLRVEDEVEAPRAWAVSIAPQADRATADAVAAQIRAAGFDDLLVVPSGPQANAIALGRYGSEESARRREAALRDAGFPAQAQPVGGATRHWLLVAAGADFDPDAAAGAASAAQARPMDCATMGAAPAR